MKQRNRLRDKVKNNSGFTLIELLVTLCLLSVLSGFMLQCFTFVMEQYRNRMDLLELEENLSISLDVIATDMADCIGVSGCNTENLTVRKTDKTVYYSTGTDEQSKEHFYNLTGKILYRKENILGNRQPMANFLFPLCITYYDSTGTITTDDTKVHLVAVEVKGEWKDTIIKQQQIFKIADSQYY